MQVVGYTHGTVGENGNSTKTTFRMLSFKTFYWHDIIMIERYRLKKISFRSDEHHCILLAVGIFIPHTDVKYIQYYQSPHFSSDCIEFLSPTQMVVML